MKKNKWLFVVALLVAPFSFATELIFDSQGNIVGSYASGAKIPGTNIAMPGGDVERSATANTSVNTRAGAVTVPTTGKITIPKAKIAQAALGCIGGGYIGAAVCAATAAQVAAEIYNQATAAGTMKQCSNPADGAYCMEQPARYAPISGYRENGLSPVVYYDNGNAVCQAWHDRLGLSYTVYYDTSTGQCKRDLPSPSTYNVVIKENRCMPGFTNPNTSFSLNQQCGTGVASQSPATPQQIEQTLQQKMDADYQANKRLADALWKDMEDAGLRGEPTPEFQNPVTPSTPASASAPPVTTPEKTVSETTVPRSDGSIDTIKEKIKSTVTPKTTGSTTGDIRVEYPVSTTTIRETTNNVTNITTTETTKEEDQDPCAANPDSVACSKLGTPGDTPKIPGQDVAATFTPVVFQSNASCPPGIPFSLGPFGGSKQISFQPACDLMTTLRPIFLACAALAVAWIFFKGVQTL